MSVTSIAAGAVAAQQGQTAASAAMAAAKKQIQLQQQFADQVMETAKALQNTSTPPTGMGRLVDTSA